MCVLLENISIQGTYKPFSIWPVEYSDSELLYTNLSKRFTLILTTLHHATSDQGKVQENTSIKLMLFMMASNVSQLSHNMIINAFIKALTTLAISPVCDGLGVSVMNNLP